MTVIVLSIVIPGLVPGTHVFLALWFQDVDGRDRPGHDMRDMCCPFRNGSAR